MVEQLKVPFEQPNGAAAQIAYHVERDLDHLLKRLEAPVALLRLQLNHLLEFRERSAHISVRLERFRRIVLVLQLHVGLASGVVGVLLSNVVNDR